MSTRLAVVDVDELREMILEAVSAATGTLAEPGRPLAPKELAAIYRVDVKRVREWLEDGMPCVRTGDVRGVRIWPDTARTWLEAHRA